jgi:pyruvate oxidase
MGAKGYTVRTKAEFEAALKDAEVSAPNKPVVIDVKLTHEMPFTTEHMFLDSSWQDPKQIEEFVTKYQAQALKPFSYFLKQAMAAQH